VNGELAIDHRWRITVTPDASNYLVELVQDPYNHLSRSTNASVLLAQQKDGALRCHMIFLTHRTEFRKGGEPCRR
jgi:hypothetical protein